MAGDNDEIFGAPPRNAASSHEIGRVSTTFPCRKSISASRPCRLKSHGSRRREVPNKHLSVPPPPFLSSTSRAEAIEPGLPCLIPRLLCESAHGCHLSE